MKSIVRAVMIATVLVAGRAGAEEQIRWAADFRTACQLAADQHRMVLLHFYNDNCEPCVRLERNVFSQAPVGEAVATNFVAVKVHAGKDPQLANRYRVRSWPTDVFVTPSGLEVYRSISPQKPDDYIALVNQVAQQTGVSAGRSWSSKLGPAVAPAAAAAADATSAAASGVRQATDQVAITAQDNVAQGQQRWSAALDQFKAASDQARATTTQTAQQVDNRWRQTQDQAATTGQQWSQQATDAVNHYEQQAGDAYRQFRDQTAQASQGVQQQAQQVRQEVGSSAQQAVDAARSTTSRWQQTFSPAATEIANTAASAATSATAAVAAAPAADKPTSPAPPLLPSENPWIAMKQQEAAATAAPAESTPALSTTSAAPPLVPQPSAAAPSSNTVKSTAPALPPPTTPPAAPGAREAYSLAVASGATVAETPPTQPAAAPAPPQFAQPAVQPPAAPPVQRPVPPVFRPGQLVDAKQAPPIAMDGFCPVTLLETVSRDPHDRSAWKKGNAMFGAIHRNRTYLFTSPEHQQKFLANPDAYAPVLSGCDPVVFAERGELLDGKRAYGLITPDKRIYLFADESALRKFNHAPGSYAAAAHQAMLRSEGGNIYR